MILYHGSNIAIDRPDLSKTKPYKDFGRGFYLSADRQQAIRMAEQRTLIMQEGSPTVTCFDFDERSLADGSLNVRLFDGYSEEWAEFILRNRDINTPQPAYNYDIIYGPIADDGVTFQLRRYMAKAISLAELVRELKYSKGVTFQYYFGTDRAISKLTRL